MKPCPKCGKHGMPQLMPGSTATARACHYCGHVEELSLPPANIDKRAAGVGGVR